MNPKDLIKRIRRLEITTNRKVNDLFVGNYKSAFKGRGVEFADIREYNEGDDYRTIDWITSAKQNKMYVKTYQETRELTTMMLVDLSSSMNFGSVEKTKRETALELLAMLCFSALKNNDKMGALFFTDKIECFIPPKKGQAHMWRILREALLKFEDNHYQSSNIEEVCQFLNTAFPHRSICFLISDEITPNPETKKKLHVTNQKHDLVFLRVIDPLEKGVTHGGLIAACDPETGESLHIDLSDKKVRERYNAIRQQKEEKLSKLLKSTQIDTLELLTTESLFKKLFWFFKQRQTSH